MFVLGPPQTDADSTRQTLVGQIPAQALGVNGRLWRRRRGSHQVEQGGEGRRKAQRLDETAAEFVGFLVKSGEFLFKSAWSHVRVG